MRNIGPKARLCRSHGINLFGSSKYDKILAKKPQPPGMHVVVKKAKLSQYGRQLKAKQVARLMFGLSEKQFRLYANKASSQAGDTADNLIKLLESRVDNVLFKSGFAKTIFQARQMINHGHFQINGKKIKTPSIQLRRGDVLAVQENMKKSKLYEDITKISPKNAKVAPKWLKTDYKQLQIEVVDAPTKDHFDPIIQIKPIVEFYSR